MQFGIIWTATTNKNDNVSLLKWSLVHKNEQTTSDHNAVIWSDVVPHLVVTGTRYVVHSTTKTPRFKWHRACDSTW